MSWTLDGWISGHARFTPEKIAIHFGEQAISYAELEQRIAQTAAVLHGRLGLRRGERIAVYAMNCPEMLVLLFAAARLGLMLVPLNWRLAQPELARILADSAPRTLFFDDHFAAQGRRLAEGQGCPSVALNDTDDPQTLPGLCAALRTLDTPQAGKPEDPLLIVYTSGTTGAARGVVLAQSSIQANALMSQHAHDMTARDHVLCMLPLFHVGGLNIQTLPVLALGGTVTLHGQFDPDAVITDIDRAGITLTLVVPTVLEAMLASPAWAAAEFTALRAFAIGSTDVPLALIDSVHARGVPVIQIYGATETGPIATYQRIERAFDTAGSIGRPGLYCEVKLMDADGCEVPEGECGEFWIRGDNVLMGYWDNPVASELNIVNGWFRSGDIGRCDAEGNYWFADRLKHVVISGGENVYPAELERVLRGHPAIAEAAVVGRADAKWGEVPVAVIVRKDSAPGAALDRDAVLGLFDGVLARYKHPRDVLFVDSLPRSALGKVQVEKVRELV